MCLFSENEIIKAFITYKGEAYTNEIEDFCNKLSLPPEVVHAELSKLFNQGQLVRTGQQRISSRKRPVGKFKVIGYNTIPIGQ